MPIRPEILKAWNDAKAQVASGVDVYATSDRQVERPQVGGETLLGNIIDVLSRGEYASALAAKDYITGKPFDLGRYTKELLEGKEKATYDELVPLVFPEMGKWKQKALGFGLAIFADPTTYIPMGLIGKGVKKAGTAVKGIKPVGKVLKKLDDTALSKAFRPSAGLPTDYYELKYYSKKGLEAEQQRILKDVQELKKGLSPDDMESLSFFREHPDEIGNLAPELREKLEQIGQKFDDLLTKGIDDGIISSEVAAKWRAKEIPYVPHYYPEQGYKLASGMMPPDLFEKVKKPSFLKKRTFETLEDAKALANDFADISKAKTMDEAANIIKQHGLEDAFNKGNFLDFNGLKSYAEVQSKYYTPDENILKAYAIRASEQASFTARTKFVDKVLDQFGTKVKAGTRAVPEGYGLYLPKGAIRFFAKDVVDSNVLVKLADKYGELIPVDELADVIKTMPSITTKVSTYMFPKSIAQDMNKFSKFFIGDPTTNKLLGLFDKAQNAWKMMATTVRLPFHLRNMYSNWWQAYLSGINPQKMPDRLLQAISFQSGNMKNIKLGGKNFTYEQLKRQVEDLGIHGKGWLGADIPQTFFNELEGIIKGGALKKLNPFDAGRKFGMMIEDNARVAVFLDQIDKGKSFKDASRAVRKYMFDYSELTDFERNVMRRVWPFYTWSRKNIPLQIQSVLQQPRKYQIYGKGMRAFAEPETKDELKLKPEYFDELLYVKSPFKTNKGKPKYMSVDLPPLEFNRMASVRHWISGMSPTKLFAEIGLNFKTFPELSPIQSQPLEKTRAPFWVAYLPQKALKVMKDNHIIGEIIDRKTGKKILGMDKKWVHGLQSAFPFMNELNRINAQPIGMDDESPEMKLKSYITGISQTALDIKFQRERDAYGKLRASDKLQKFSSQHGRMPTEEEMDILDPDDFLSGLYGGQ